MSKRNGKSRRKTTRDEVIAWRAFDRYATATEIARGLTATGHPITRERVRQILETEGLEARPRPRPVPVPPSRRAS